MPSVELHSAWVWDCDSCGRENLEHGVTVEMTPEEAKAQAEAMGEPEAAEGMVRGEWMTQPVKVTCAHCAAEFDVEPPEGGA